MSRSNVIESYQERRGNGLRLYCFPFAGGSAALYADWHELLPSWIDVCPVQLPGRGRRSREKPLTDLAQLAHCLAEDLEDAIDQTPYAMFGYSMGAFVAFEVARDLARRGKSLPEHLFVTAQKGPSVPSRPPYWYGLEQDELIGKLRDLGGTSEVMLNSQVMLNLFLPVIRADCAVMEGYRYAEQPKLPVPITAFCAIDDTMATPQSMMAWETATSETFRFETVTGGHFFINDPGRREQLLSRLIDHLKGIRVA